MNKTKSGRPKVTSKPDVVSILITSFHSGMTVRDACLQSGISHEVYYRRLRTDGHFADTMTTAQVYATSMARKVILDAIEAGDVGAAKWWLERKARDEFGRSVTVAAVVIESDSKESYVDTHAEITKMLENYTKYRDDMLRLRGKCDPQVEQLIKSATLEL